MPHRAPVRPTAIALLLAVWELVYRAETGEASGIDGVVLELAAVRPDDALVSPYLGQQAPFTATAWGARLAVDDPSDSRLREFVDLSAGGPQGGEEGADCANGTTAEDARAALAAADGT